MAVTNLPSKTSPKTHSEKFINRIKADYKQFNFRPGKHEHWSPKTNTITYSLEENYEELKYGLLHELSHALLDHNNYHSDFELLKLETEAWELAAKIGKKYGVKLDDEHIQDCLDTYRNWLHRRSTCPVCGMHVFQKNSKTYQCFNCHAIWSVSSGRFVRSYRRTIK